MERKGRIVLYAAMSVFIAAAATVSAAEADLQAMMARLEAQEARLAEQDAKLAEQEARMHDLQAKLSSDNDGGNGGEVEGVLSIQKNAVVTIGGYLTTGYYATRAKVDSVYDEDGVDQGVYRRRADFKQNNLSITDAELSIAVKVNDHFDAYLLLDLNNSSDYSGYGLAKQYWIRWQNICESGFGLKVGRDQLVFGEEGYGYLYSHAGTHGDGLEFLSGDYIDNFPGVTGFDGLLVPPHNIWYNNGVNQVTPYWEGLDGRLSVELSLMSNVDNTGPKGNIDWSEANYRRNKNGVAKYRTLNYGVGSMSGRIRYSPVEGLQLTAGLVNFRVNGRGDSYADDYGHSKNNTALALAFSYTPTFAPKLTLWSQWIHGWNVNNYEDLKADALNFGASYDLTDALTVFAQGDYLRSRYTFDGANNKGTGWTVYGGLIYTLPYGVIVEAGWKHEQYKYRENGRRTAKIWGDTIYANLGFEF